VILRKVKWCNQLVEKHLVKKKGVIVVHTSADGRDRYFFLDKKKMTDNDTDIKAIHPPDSWMSKLSNSYVVTGFHLHSFCDTKLPLQFLKG